MATTLRAGQPRSRDSFPGKGKTFFFSLQIGSRAGTASYVTGPEGRLLMVKRQERDADHSSPFSTEVKEGGAVRSLLHAPSWRGTLLIKA
jgi:hypothetical protein